MANQNTCHNTKAKRAELSCGNSPLGVATTTTRRLVVCRKAFEIQNHTTSHKLPAPNAPVFTPFGSLAAACASLAAAGRRCWRIDRDQGRGGWWLHHYPARPSQPDLFGTKPPPANNRHSNTKKMSL